MKHLVYNIGILAGIQEQSRLLHGSDLASLVQLEGAFVIIKDGVIVDYGAGDGSHSTFEADEKTDANGGLLMPCWCDSHTHLVFPGSRENEFVDKIKGLDYAAIAARGGGILSTSKRVHQTSEEALLMIASARLRKLMRLGTGAIEIKSGYGLDTENELKMLRVIKKLKASFPIPIKATFLGAHTVPQNFQKNKKDYINIVINEMIPAVAAEGLADYIDVFCEKGFFSYEETIDICQAGKNAGMVPKIHANQLSISKGVEAGVKVGARSVDHLESMDDAAIRSLATSGTIGTLLPTAAFFLRMNFPPARELIAQGAAIALASDFNPGSSPSGNMNFVTSLACIQMKLLPEEAINAATINGAFAMDVQATVGSVTRGKIANFILTPPVPSIAYLPYSFGENLIKKVMIAGNWLSERAGD